MTNIEPSKAPTLDRDTVAACTEAAQAEYLHDDTGTPEDEAYNQGVTDAIAAIGALLEGAK